VPEGDTIHRSATALRAALIGKIMTGFEAPRLSGLSPARGSTIERVTSRGKHIEIGWDDGVVLHTHMRMTGSWHLYRPGERWRKSSKHMRAVIEVEGFEAVCFNAPVVETYREGDVVAHPGRGGLGPDLTDEHSDLDECVERIPRFCDEGTTAAEMLLDQRIACGVGNVYKSEVLWACGVHPLTPVAALDLETRAALIDTAASFLQANLEQPARVTLPGSADGVAVYGRYGKPCYRCGQPIEVRRYGEQSRVTYWCDNCQERIDLDRQEWSRAGAPTPVDLASAKERRRPPVLFDDSGDLTGPVDHEQVAPALERHPASQRLLSGFPPRGPEPHFVDPLLGREHAGPYDDGDDEDGGGAEGVRSIG
jgi:endonuclease-8